MYKVACTKSEKKDKHIMLVLQILPLNRRNLPNLREDHPNDMNDLVTASDFYDIKPSVYKEFKVIIKIHYHASIYTNM